MSLSDEGSTEQSDTQVLPSIFSAPPADTGGIHARQGFAYQDDVAVCFYLQMLSITDLIEVSCETYDDILLVWQNGGDKTVEFVQVKAEHLDQLWTVAELCKRIKPSKNPDGAGTSVLEKSLGRDQYRELSWFRIVTCRQVDSDLTVLGRERQHDHRTLSYAPFKSLADQIQSRLPGVKSKKGNNCLYWLTNSRWDVFSENDIERLNKHTLAEVLYKLDMPYDPDAVRAIYDNLRTLAKKTAELGVDKWAQKRVSRDKLSSMLRIWVDPYPDKSKVARLERKLNDAGLDSVCLNAATDQQRFYLRKKRSDSYFSFEQVEEIELRVLDKLHSLRSSLDSGKIKANGTQFHDLCLREVRSLQPPLEMTGVPSIPGYLAGCMYEITSRCRHRFTRFQP